MALFAAYSSANDNQGPETENFEMGAGWLQNDSFRIDVTPTQPPSESVKLHRSHFQTTKSSESENEEDASSVSTKRKHKKSKKKSKKTKKFQNAEEIPIESEHYSIDTKKTSQFKNITTIARPSAPKYYIYSYFSKDLRKPKARKFKRYYQVISKSKDSSASEEEKLFKKDLQKDNLKKGKDENFIGFKEEEELSKITAKYNKDLGLDPENIEMWVKYVNFQDTVYQFEKSFRKGSMAKGLRVLAERKLSILDKALSHNPNCEVLLRTRLNIAVSVYPADELQQQLRKLTEKEQGNIILWQGYIEATQCSMSHCTTSTVLSLYIKCLHTLHKLRRSAKVEKAQLEESILRMLYQCGLFLKQAGLFEQLWTLLRMYLELNLSGDDKFSIFSAPDETQLVELEEIVLKSQLPIHELWLRVEKLREASHWMPSIDESADPQRLVFPEDVSELIHPITMPGNTFKLTVTILTLLKIPLLPCRHTTMKEFGTDYVPWALDSVETLLPLFVPNYQIDIVTKHILKFSQKLAVGPQYLKSLPGQEEYLQFILTVMKSCIDCLKDDEKLAITIWWFRFQRLLIVLEKLELFKISNAFKKKLKGEMKNVLRQNSSNVILFKEYANIELEQGFDAANNILKTSLGLIQGPAKSFRDLTRSELPANCAALRSFIELNIFKSNDSDNKKLCLKYIINLISGKSTNDLPRFITKTLIDETKDTFSTLLNKYLGEEYLEKKVGGTNHFLPDFLTDWVIMNGWFLYLNDGLKDCRILVEYVIEKLDKFEENSWRKEVLSEFLVALLFKECTQVSGSGLFPLLDSTMRLAIENFPNNLFVLTTLAKVQSLHSNYGYSWWKAQSLLLKSGHALSTLFLILITNQRIADIEENWKDSITGEILSTGNNFHNRMLSLFKRLTRADMCTRRCGLLWRLYLQFLHAYFDPTMCRNAYYTAVEECPWLKALYIDAAIYVPEELAQIQDLIIEKQLRIHVTPEELDVLRN